MSISKQKDSQEKFSMYLSLFKITKLFLKSESLLLFKLNMMMVAIGKKPALRVHESILKVVTCKISLLKIISLQNMENKLSKLCNRKNETLFCNCLDRNRW